MFNSFLTKEGASALAITLIVIYSIRYLWLGLYHVGRARYYSTPRTQYPQTVDLWQIAVVLPVVDHVNDNLLPTIESILVNRPQQLYVVLVGQEAFDKVEAQMAPLREKYGYTQINVGAVNRTNKRRQIAHALKHIQPSVHSLTVITEQGTYWPDRFLMSACCPFDDAEVAAVTVPKRAHLRPSNCIWDKVKAHLFSFYYSIQAEDNRAVNSFDGSALFGGGATLVRTHYLKNDRFKKEFEHEKWFFGRSGVLKGDEHFFLNRFFLGGNKYVYFQDSPEATVSVEVNTVGHFLSEFLRETRNNWRTCWDMAITSHWLLIRRRHVIYPASAFMTWWPNIFSFVLLSDILSVIMAFNYDLLHDDLLYGWLAVHGAVLVLQAMVGLFVAIRMHRSDGSDFNIVVTFLCLLLSLPFQYALEFVKIAAMLTFWKADTEERASNDIEMTGDSELRWSWGYMFIHDNDEFWNAATWFMIVMVDEDEASHRST
ncbi:hypothetical protein NW752_006349 [Fusarium irregulare]|uniref:Glycosyltransferase family 2 protein n=1 Tax=Fusarium irregulare TaxID=2494466 RepID=A0A9W8PP97_9HYPO|nr:hypothetical protein NW766_006892 [Fusarium irregulare]KAJ4017262.1 hypothetical protein NW752_006349 [Fusarium irregulare]